VVTPGAGRGFAGKNVELAAVNMEESPGPVKSLLDRLKWNVTVARERDGTAARPSVGGGKATADALHEALQELSAK
jgi:hypothetical protein